MVRQQLRKLQRILIRGKGLSRYLVLQLHKNPNVQLGSYRSYPGYTVAQVREKLGIGW